MADITTAFSGTNGAAPPSPWSVLSGAATIQGNRLEIVSPATQWSAGEVRANQTVDDFLMIVIIRVSIITNNSPRVNLRWDPATGNGYRVIIGNEFNEITLLRVDSFVETQLVTATLPLSVDTDYRLSIEANGTLLSVKRWQDGTGEPGSPILQTTDATYTSGDISLVTVTAANATATSAWSSFSLDDYTPDPDLPTDFTGTDNAPWPLPWTSVTGTNTIDTNRGKQVTAAVAFDTARARANKVYSSQRYDAQFQVPAITEGAMVLDVCSDGSGGSGYRLIIGTSYGQIQPFRVTAFTEQALDTPKSMTFLANTWYRVAAETNNGLIRFKIWRATDSEPSSWHFIIYDTTHANGDIVLGTKTLGATAVTGFWDDISVSIPQPDTTTPIAVLNDPTPPGQTTGYEHIRGLVNLTATATDDTVIANLTFYDGDPQNNGIILGTVTSSPYIAVWDTRNVANGPHQLYAVANDVATNSGISAPVAVIVNNSGVWAPGATRALPVSLL